MQTIMFPFDRVKKDANIAIYGGGEIGAFFLRQLAAVPYCQPRWLVDKKFIQPQQQDGCLQLSAQAMDWQQPDQIVLASLLFQDDMHQYLISQGVEPSRIVVIDKSQYLDVLDALESRLQATPADNAWGSYYKSAEAAAEQQFAQFIAPILKQMQGQFDFSQVVDFACGEGRIAQLMADRCQALQLVDASSDAISYCRQRFCDMPHVSMQANHAGALPQADASVSLVYSWDAMVHFSYKSLDYYVSEFHRILRTGGHVLIHHSNLGALASTVRVFDQWNLNSGGRSNITRQDLAFIAQKHGFEIVSQSLMDWNHPQMDCISVLRKRA